MLAHLKTTTGADCQQSSFQPQFPQVQPPEEWIKTLPIEDMKQQFDRDGFIAVNDVIDAESLEVYRKLYDSFVDGTIDCKTHRWDLGNFQPRSQQQSENVCQIMWPSDFVKGLSDGPLHRRTNELARILLGDDVNFDFDMLIYKAPHTNTEVPWHQDEGYWPDVPDKRAVSCWVALDEATVDNGCMWFVPGSHNQPLRKHKPATAGVHVLMAEQCDESEGRAIPLKPGSCTLHHGRTLHHTRGNSTATRRRAYITNYRPQAMIDLERQLNFDHGRKGVV